MSYNVGYLFQAIQNWQRDWGFICYREIMGIWSPSFKMEMARFVTKHRNLACFCYRKSVLDCWLYCAHYSVVLSLDVQITVNCVENIPAVELVLGKDVFLTVGEYYNTTWWKLISFFFSSFLSWKIGNGKFANMFLENLIWLLLYKWGH